MEFVKWLVYWLKSSCENAIRLFQLKRPYWPRSEPTLPFVLLQLVQYSVSICLIIAVVEVYMMSLRMVESPFPNVDPQEHLAVSSSWKRSGSSWPDRKGFSLKASLGNPIHFGGGIERWDTGRVSFRVRREWRIWAARAVALSSSTSSSSRSSRSRASLTAIPICRQLLHQQAHWYRTTVALDMTCTSTSLQRYAEQLSFSGSGEFRFQTLLQPKSTDDCRDTKIRDGHQDLLPWRLDAAFHLQIARGIRCVGRYSFFWKVGNRMSSAGCFLCPTSWKHAWISQTTSVNLDFNMINPQDISPHILVLQSKTSLWNSWVGKSTAGQYTPIFSNSLS